MSKVLEILSPWCHFSGCKIILDVSVIHIPPKNIIHQESNEKMTTSSFHCSGGCWHFFCFGFLGWFFFWWLVVLVLFGLILLLFAWFLDCRLCLFGLSWGFCVCHWPSDEIADS